MNSKLAVLLVMGLLAGCGNEDSTQPTTEIYYDEFDEQNIKKYDDTLEKAKEAIEGDSKAKP